VITAKPLRCVFSGWLSSRQPSRTVVLLIAIFGSLSTASAACRLSAGRGSGHRQGRSAPSLCRAALVAAPVAIRLPPATSTSGGSRPSGSVCRGSGQPVSRLVVDNVHGEAQRSASSAPAARLRVATRPPMHALTTMMSVTVERLVSHVIDVPSIVGRGRTPSRPGTGPCPPGRQPFASLGTLLTGGRKLLPGPDLVGLPAL
jgi:hypothetical protein